MNLFGKPKTAKEVLKENKKEIRHSQHDLDREYLTLEREEKKVILEIKRLAKAGQNASAKTMAKELIRLRTQKEKLLLAKSRLSTVSTRASTMQASQTVAKSMQGATAAMTYANQATPVMQMQRTMQAYEKQSEMASMKEEMMDDLMDGGPEEEEEAEEAMNAVLDSIGLDISAQMSSAKPSTAPLGSQRTKTKEDQDLDKLLASMP